MHDDEQPTGHTREQLIEFLAAWMRRDPPVTLETMIEVGAPSAAESRAGASSASASAMRAEWKAPATPSGMATPPSSSARFPTKRTDTSSPETAVWLGAL